MINTSLFLFYRTLFLTKALGEKAKSIKGVDQWPYKAVSTALEVIPRTLIQNCGANTIRTLTALRVSGLRMFCMGIAVKGWCKCC